MHERAGLAISIQSVVIAISAAARKSIKENERGDETSGPEPGRAVSNCVPEEKSWAPDCASVVSRMPRSSCVRAAYCCNPG